MAQMFNFFRGMHLVVNMAEHVSESLKLFKQAHPTETERHISNDSSSGTIKLIRIACKAFEKRDEKSGYPLQLNTYLTQMV